MPLLAVGDELVAVTASMAGVAGAVGGVVPVGVAGAVGTAGLAVVLESCCEPTPLPVVTLEFPSAVDVVEPSGVGLVPLVEVEVDVECTDVVEPGAGSLSRVELVADLGESVSDDAELLSEDEDEDEEEGEESSAAATPWPVATAVNSQADTANPP